MPIIFKEIIVRATVDNNPQWSEQLDKLISEVKQQVLEELEAEKESDNSRFNRTDR